VSEHVIVWQNDQFEIEFRAAEPVEDEQAKTEEPEPVYHIHELTPYGQMLTSLGSCTTIVLHTYAQHHEVPLKEVTIDLRYERVFHEDCENCEEIERYEEQIEEQIAFEGDLSDRQRDKLLHIAHQCSIRKILEDGLKIESRLAD
jgi:putative redox protein